MGTAVAVPVYTLLTQPNRCSQKFSHTQNYSARRGSLSIKAGGRVGGSEGEKTQNGRQPRYHPEYNYYDYDDEEFGGFRKNSGKQRIWWSDDSSSTWDTDSDDEDDEDDDEDDGFGVLEGSIGGFSSIFKVFRSFGWMVPAIAISMLLGTGSNAFVMALALPLAQSVLSSLLDIVWGKSADNRTPKSRSQNRKRAFSGAAGGSRMREERGRSRPNGKSADDYKSWVATDNVSTGKGEGRTRSFGGWDELDKQRRKNKEPETATANEKRGQTQGKLSKRARNRQTPLLVRLLIAFFPFLGFWTKLL